MFTFYFIYTLCILFCVCIHSIYIKMDIYLLNNFIPLLHYCLIIAYLIYSFSYYLQTHIFLFLCVIYFHSILVVCAYYIYIYILSILFIFVFIVSFYFRSCLSLCLNLNHLVCINIYPFRSFLSVLCICIFSYARLSNSIPYLNIIYV